MRFSASSRSYSLALYLALKAARDHCIAVRFSNENLKICLGKKMGRRLSKPQINEFAATFKPIFRHHAIDHDRDNNLRLILYFNKEDEPAKERQISAAYCLIQSSINKELGIELIS